MQKIINNALFLVSLLILFILFGFNEWNGDRDAYEDLFTGDSWMSTEPGYTFINNYFNEIGFTYDQFQAIIALICILLIGKYAMYNIKNRLLFIAFYGITLFPLDYVLIRNFLSFSLLIQGISLLNSNKNRIFLYTVIILISATIHQSAFLFIIFVFTKKEKINSQKFLLIALSYFAIFFMAKNFIFSELGVIDHLLIYKQTFKGGIANTILHAIAILPAIYISKKYPNASKNNNKIYNLNLLSILFFPLYFESEIFIRLLRVVIFLNACYFIDLPRIKPYILYSFFYILIFSLFLFFQFNLPFFDDSAAPLLKNNKVINYIW